VLALSAVAVFALDAARIPMPAQVEPDAGAVRRCPHCGWIESKRQIQPDVADPHALQIYEYTLRMADGSSRVFQETFPASWRVGERLVLIDGSSLKTGE
jgi:hypothetical protein